jgi:ectoine hydroxylase-related dioxygenase (phytanoyl-CoA dioxygenase family)
MTVALDTRPGAANRVSLACEDSAAALAQAEAVFRRDGVVVLDDLVDPALLARCKAEIEAGYPELDRVDPERNFGSYAGRHTMPLRVEGTLANRAIFLPQPILDFAGALLGKQFMLESLGLLVSLPGAEDQPRHPDALLYTEGTDRLLPPFAVAFALPLVPMDEVTGTTAFWRGSHRKPEQTGPYDFAPVVQPGSALLWDFRIFHCGLANRSGAPRPLIYSTLCREWWRETVSIEAKRYEKLVIAREVYDSLGQRLRQAVSRALIVGDAAEQARREHLLPNGI